MGGLTLFAAQGCKAPKQVAEQAKIQTSSMYFLISIAIRQWAFGTRKVSEIK